MRQIAMGILLILGLQIAAVTALMFTPLGGHLVDQVFDRYVLDRIAQRVGPLEDLLWEQLPLQDC